jgi:hypothetical protein
MAQFLTLKVVVKTKFELIPENYPGEQFRYPNGDFNYDAAAASEVEAAKDDPDAFFEVSDFDGEFMTEVTSEADEERPDPDPEYPHGGPF